MDKSVRKETKNKDKPLHTVQIDKGILLDGIKLKGVSAYSITQDENEDAARLVLEMDVSIL